MVVTHKITHQYQPTNKSCSQTSLAMLFSYFGKTMTPGEVIAEVPVNKNDKGEDQGTLNQELATWCLSQGFKVRMHTADFQIIDTAWKDLPVDQLIQRMESAKPYRDVPALGKAISERYVQSYIDFVKQGGELHIEPFMTTDLLDRLLPNSPILIAVCYNVLYATGRTKSFGLRQTAPNDTEGGLTTHSVVVYGKNDVGLYQVADPWQEPGFHEIDPRRLVAAMDAAQIECDNVLFQLAKKS